MVVIIDYGMGNIGSVANMLNKLGTKNRISADPGEIRSAAKLILPGVGAFDTAMSRLRESGLVDVLHEQVLQRGISILGICLGMQVMGDSSEEGEHRGLGWIRARSVRFEFGNETSALRVPHMGWNLVRPVSPSPLMDGMPEQSRFYFVHSYHVVCESPADVMLSTTYGHDFASGIRKDNVFGVQFHPEKSHKFGIQLLRNFVERC